MANNMSSNTAEDIVMHGAIRLDSPQFGVMDPLSEETHPQAYYDAIKQRFAEERDLRINYRPEGSKQYDTELQGELAKYDQDPYAGPVAPRAQLTDTVECLFIGGGFSALLTSARLREIGVDSIRIVERGADVGGTWYWNRYPGIACDVPSYDYLPLLDEMNYVPKHRYARGDEIFQHCRAIAKKYDLYDLAVFQTTVIETRWDKAELLWHIRTDRGDHMKARFVICANGILSKPKLTKIQGMETFKGHSFHTSRWDYAYTGDDLSGLKDKRVGIIGTGATAVQAVPGLGANAKELYVFQRTPSSIDIRDDWETDPEWAKKLPAGWQMQRRNLMLKPKPLSPEALAKIAAMPREEKLRRQENANIDSMMRIHKRIEEIVKDKATAEALKPWYMMMCKRPCFHDAYLQAFNQPNCHLVDTDGRGVERITERGPVVAGMQYDVDCIVYASGFEVGTPYTARSGFDLVGRGGLKLSDAWADGMRSLHGVHVHGFPNAFFVQPTQGANLISNVPHNLTESGRTIAMVVRHALDQGHQRVEVTLAAQDAWVQLLLSGPGRMIGGPDCTPGYYNNEGQAPTAASRLAVGYPAGPSAYFQYLASWRGNGRFEGLAFS